MQDEETRTPEEVQAEAILGLLGPKLGEMVAAKVAEVDKVLRAPRELIFGPDGTPISKIEGEAVTGHFFKTLLQGAHGVIHPYECSQKLKALSVQSWQRMDVAKDHPYHDAFMSAQEKALAEGADATGGYLVPVETLATVLLRVEELTTLDPYVSHIAVNSNAGELPTSLAAITRRWGTSENSEPTESCPAFGQETYAINPVHLICKVSEDVMADSVVSVANLVTQRFAEAMADEREYVIAVGTGSSQPVGVASCSVTQSVSVGTLAWDSFTSIMWKLPKRYWNLGSGARWVMSETLEGRCFGLKDSTGQPIIKTDPTTGITSILGRQISTNPNFPDDKIWFANLSRLYAIFDRMTLSIKTDAAGVHFDKDQISIKAKQRYDGKCVDVSAASVGNNITA